MDWNNCYKGNKKGSVLLTLIRRGRAGELFHQQREGTSDRVMVGSGNLGRSERDWSRAHERQDGTRPVGLVQWPEAIWIAILIRSGGKGEFCY